VSQATGISTAESRSNGPAASAVLALQQTPVASDYADRAEVNPIDGGSATSLLFCGPSTVSMNFCPQV
jgi:hypothetical protein